MEPEGSLPLLKVPVTCPYLSQINPVNAPPSNPLLKYPSLFIFSLLHRACCQVTQLLYHQLHLYKFVKFTY